jgi:hypothetical protein
MNYAVPVASSNAISMGWSLGIANGGTSGSWQPHAAGYNATVGQRGLGALSPDVANNGSAIVACRGTNATNFANPFSILYGYRIFWEAEIIAHATTIQGSQQVGFILATAPRTTTARGLHAMKPTNGNHTWTFYMGDGTTGVNLGSVTLVDSAITKLGAIYYGNDFAEAFVNNQSLGRVSVAALNPASAFSNTSTTGAVSPTINTLTQVNDNSTLYHRDMFFACELPFRGT